MALPDIDTKRLLSASLEKTLPSIKVDTHREAILACCVPDTVFLAFGEALVTEKERLVKERSNELSQKYVKEQQAADQEEEKQDIAAGDADSTLQSEYEAKKIVLESELNALHRRLTDHLMKNYEPPLRLQQLNNKLESLAPSNSQSERLQLENEIAQLRVSIDKANEDKKHIETEISQKNQQKIEVVRMLTQELPNRDKERTARMQYRFVRLLSEGMHMRKVLSDERFAAFQDEAQKAETEISALYANHYDYNIIKDFGYRMYLEALVKYLEKPEAIGTEAEKKTLHTMCGYMLDYLNLQKSLGVLKEFRRNSEQAIDEQKGRLASLKDSKTTGIGETKSSQDSTLPGKRKGIGFTVIAAVTLGLVLWFTVSLMALLITLAILSLATAAAYQYHSDNRQVEKQSELLTSKIATLEADLVENARAIEKIQADMASRHRDAEQLWTKKSPVNKSMSLPGNVCESGHGFFSTENTHASSIGEDAVPTTDKKLTK